MLVTDTYGGNARILPESKAKELESSMPDKTIPRVEGGHYAEWLRACKGGDPAGSNFEYAGPFTETVLLGNLAIRTGRRLDWDSANLRVTNLADANRFVRDSYRDGYSV